MHLRDSTKSVIPWQIHYRNYKITNYAFHNNVTMTPNISCNRVQVHEARLWNVVDGNMKNHRQVCFATKAGYVDYRGLPGRVRTGCPNSPDYQSAFCHIHKPAVAMRQNIGDGDDMPAAESMSEKGQLVILLINGLHGTPLCTRYAYDYKQLKLPGLRLR